MSEQPTSNASEASEAAVPEAVSQNRFLFLILGIILIGVGIFAIAFPFVATIAAKIFLGWLFLISGGVQIIHAFSTRRWAQFIIDLLIGALYVFAGIWLTFFPLTTVVTLTLFLAVLFVIHGVLEAGMALRMRPSKGWMWMLFAAILAIVVGVLIFYKLPSSAAWAIGTLVGIKLISSGWAYFSLSLGGDD
jgi:uncharacterized membrane protein HdeD (DUF308 family)